MEKLGLSYEDLKQRKPDIIFASGTGWGLNGPMVDRTAQDLIIQARSGLVAATGPGDRSNAVGCAVVDQRGGALLAMGILAAYAKKLTTGKGTHVQGSLLNSGIDLQTEPLTNYMSSRPGSGVFKRQENLVSGLLGAANYLGADAGLAALYDLALLSGMYGIFAGFFHATALVNSERVSARSFLDLLGPWMSAMVEELPDFAERIDSNRHGRNVASNLGMQTTAPDNILTASRQQGIATDLLDPLLPLFRERAAAGYSQEDISSIFELIRTKDR